MYTEKELDGLNQVELKELYMELWLAKHNEESEIVFNYIEENYPHILKEEF